MESWTSRTSWPRWPFGLLILLNWRNLPVTTPALLMIVHIRKRARTHRDQTDHHELRNKSVSSWQFLFCKLVGIEFRDLKHHTQSIYALFYFSGSENGGGCFEKASGSRPRVPIHRLRPKRPFQLRGDATPEQELGRAETSSGQGIFLSINHTQAGISDSKGRHFVLIF